MATAIYYRDSRSGENGKCIDGPAGVAEKKKRPRLVIGWREWVALPELGIDAINAKVDTGARTSALHAFDLEPDVDGETLRFRVHPVQRDEKTTAECVATIVDRRRVRNSGGQEELRYVVRTPMLLGDRRWSIEVTLTTRFGMDHRMLLGRSAIRRRVTIDPGRSYLVGKPGEKPE